MNSFSRFCGGKALLLVVITCIFLSAAETTFSSSTPSASDPWSRSQVIAPQILVEELRKVESPKPVIVCVGFQFSYERDHIVGALLKGPARTSEGTETLKKWAQTIPKNTPVVIYCGCCPFKECPNIRPAYKALRRAGLTRVQVLYLEHGFLTDWVQQGYPVERAK